MRAKRYFSTFNFQLSTPAGFTFIEILVAITIIAAVSGVILSILFISLRGSRKSDLLVMLKQNGNFALSQMVNSIRYARNLDSPLSCNPPVTTSFLTITSILDNGQTTFRCPAQLSDGITSNSASLIDVNDISVTSCSFTCNQQTDYDPPAITIQFVLSSRKANSFVETTGSIPFQTTVTMRNFQR